MLLLSMPLSTSAEKKNSISVPHGIVRGGASYEVLSPDPASTSRTKLSNMLLIVVVAVFVRLSRVSVYVVLVFVVVVVLVFVLVLKSLDVF